MDKILFNNEIIERDQMVDIEDRGYQFGDGIYEVIGVYDKVPFLMEEHMKRLKRSAKEISLNLPYEVEALEKKLMELIQANRLHEGIIYFQVSRGAAPRWHEFPGEDISPITIAYTREEDSTREIEDNGAKAILADDIRWLRCDIKTLNLLPNVLAKQEAVENDAIEAILHRDGIVTEACSSNVFIVKNGTLYTHPATNRILNGITRMKIIEICKDNHLPISEEVFTVNELLNADEVFVSATKSDIIPILQVDDQSIGDGRPGEITKRVQEEFRLTIDALLKTV